MVRNDDIHYKLEDINNFLRKKYRLDNQKRERDWQTYEQEFSTRINLAMKHLASPDTVSRVIHEDHS